MTKTIHILLVDDDPAENVILRAQISKVANLAIELHYCETIESALELIGARHEISMVLMDNRLQPMHDFRETVPALRQSGFIGPVGVISSSVTDPYFQDIAEYGADFRIDKAEIDPTALAFIMREYVSGL